jgi:CheY-like chemotaxis protein
MHQLSSIVYVEDDRQSREIMELLLVIKMGLPQVTIFEDSADFLLRLEHLQPKPDLIMLDIHMRPYTGFELLEMLRQHDQWRSVPVVALTASVMNEEVQKLRDAGFNGVVPKPIDLETFPDILHRVLAGEEVWNTVS